MAVFRVEKNHDFTVMSNHHLRNEKLTLKAKGLLSLMLSLPESWDYTLKGLTFICKEGVDAIRVAVLELEKEGYVERKRKRNEKGQLAEIEYVIREFPMVEQPELGKPILENPTLDNQTLENPMLDFPTQLNTEEQNKDKQNTDVKKYPSFNPEESEQCQGIGWIERYNENLKLVKENIEYESFENSRNKCVIDELLEIMAEVLTVDAPYYTIENRKYPTEIVRERFLRITRDKLEGFLLDFTRMTSKIHNTKAYMITALFNMPATADTSLSNIVQNDLYRIGGT